MDAKSITAQSRQLKSILKPSRSSHSPQADSKAEAERIALAHARIIQQQRDLEAQIVDAIDTLSTFPSVRSASFSASNPSPSDISRFKSLLRPFQPSDYDDLIEERNILGHCGYALCPSPRRRDQGGKFKLVNKNRPDFAIIETKELEKWCSDQCARRALYVKVQLNETAAWERVAMPTVDIDLLDEEDRKEQKESTDTDLARNVAQLKLSEDRKASKVSAALSLERGDAARMSLGPRVELTIREKEVTSDAVPPRLETGGEDDGHLLLEGHKSRFWTKTEDTEADDNVEEEPAN